MNFSQLGLLIDSVELKVADPHAVTLVVADVLGPGTALDVNQLADRKLVKFYSDDGASIVLLKFNFVKKDFNITFKVSLNSILLQQNLCVTANWLQNPECTSNNFTFTMSEEL